MRLHCACKDVPIKLPFCLCIVMIYGYHRHITIFQSPHTPIAADLKEFGDGR